MNKKLILVVLAIIIGLSITVLAIDSRLKTVFYKIENEHIDENIRIAFISDLHSCRYGGDDQSDLIEAVRAQNPDLVLIGGDAFDTKMKPEPTFVAMEALAKEFPCYYSLGNHEQSRDDLEELLEKAESLGVVILRNEVAPLEIKGQKINLCGADDPTFKSEYETCALLFMPMELEDIRQMKEKAGEGFEILLFHRPESYFNCIQMEYDLVLSGHAHGGQWRIPGILDGLYAPGQGFFPDYAGGKHSKNNTVLIVSRGLAKESTIVPRIFNRPELVIIEIE